MECLQPTIEVNQAAGALGKCGHLHEGRYYLKRITEVLIDYGPSEEAFFECGDDPALITIYSLSTKTEEFTFDEEALACAGPTVVYEGTRSSSIVCQGPTWTWSESLSATQNADGSWSGDIFLGGQTPTTTITHEDEYTTAQLLERAEQLELSFDPEGWAGVLDGSTIASRSLAPGGNSIYLERAKFRFKHRPTASCYLKVWVLLIFTPEEGDPVEERVEYEWTGTGRPCVPDSAASIDGEDNLITSTEFDVALPTENGTMSIWLLKWSCLPGYVPDDPDLETFFRPSPDCRPNGFPYMGTELAC
jgi:hypothetical protein